MTVRELRRALFVVENQDADVVIQLPDNEPPVGFTIDPGYSNTVVLFPAPPDGGVWDHDHNVIKEV